MTDNNKWTSLQCYGIYYCCKKFYDTGPRCLKPNIFGILIKCFGILSIRGIFKNDKRCKKVQPQACLLMSPCSDFLILLSQIREPLVLPLLLMQKVPFLAEMHFAWKWQKCENIFSTFILSWRHCIVSWDHRYLRKVDCTRILISKKFHFNKSKGRRHIDETKQAGWVNTAPSLTRWHYQSQV